MIVSIRVMDYSSGAVIEEREIPIQSADGYRVRMTEATEDGKATMVIAQVYPIKADS